MVRGGFTCPGKAFTFVELVSACVQLVNLQPRAAAFFTSSSNYPSERCRPDALPLEPRRDFDEFQPEVVVARAQVHGSYGRDAELDDEYRVVLHQGLEELDLLIDIPRPVSLLDEVSVGVLVKLKQPGAIFRNRRPELNFHGTTVANRNLAECHAKHRSHRPIAHGPEGPDEKIRCSPSATSTSSIGGPFRHALALPVLGASAHGDGHEAHRSQNDGDPDCREGDGVGVDDRLSP